MTLAMTKTLIPQTAPAQVTLAGGGDAMIPTASARAGRRPGG
jgi:hypothetical protein